MLLNLSVLTSLLTLLPISTVLGRDESVVENLDKFPDIKPSFPTPGKLRLTENSGICETTPGVYQASGYIDLVTGGSIFFWFFAARKDPDTAPVSVWLNGGPGTSSMIGLLRENGPCRISNDSQSVSHNPHSWNEVSNMLFIDQPVGAGFSHGPLRIGTSQQAALDFWEFLQIFFVDPRFSKYQENDFAIWTESFGGRYAPIFAAHLLQQNTGIANGTVSGTPINLKSIGIGNPLTDPLTQYASFITYAASNPYHRTVNDSTIAIGNDSWTKPGGCRDQIAQCYDTNDDSTCSNAQLYCYDELLAPLAGIYDQYYVPAELPDEYPPDLTDYLFSDAVTRKLGAESTWQRMNRGVFNNFLRTGDWMHNARPDLETVIDAGVRTFIYDGDADYILNYIGVEAMVDLLETKFSAEYANQRFTNYTVNGVSAGLYKNAGTFSYARIFGAGHEVPAYSWGSLSAGEVALQFFSQIMNNSSLFST